ncbi:MAG: amino acid permease, partial [Alphaproteobacteria bacterium]|nr:amino acid permease [Alphaproteobacteria bacterium]
AGANMSGDLKDPRRSIPIGTLWAIGISLLIYIALAVWVSKTGTLEEAAQNYYHVIDKSLFPPLVVVGLLGATASSALAGLVGGPRILMAMGQHRIIPMSEPLSRLDDGEPRNALAATGVLTLLAIMLRDLNAIAPLVTMFFLITYCMINVVVLIEGSLGLVSYRPTLRVPLFVPAIGLVGCVFSMFIINPTFSLISVVMVLGLYMFIGRRTRDREGAKEDVRSSIFIAFAEWAAARITPEDSENVRAWKPHLLVPVEDVEKLRGSYPLLLDLSRPEGTIKLLGLCTIEPAETLSPRVERIGRTMRQQDVLASWSMVGLSDYETAVVIGMEALQGTFFTPNLLFVELAPDGPRREAYTRVIQSGLAHRVGVMVYGAHPSVGLGRKKDIYLWVQGGRETWDPHASFETGNLNLILLMGYRLWRNWRGRLALVTVVPSPKQQPAARAFLDALCDLARFPDEIERVVLCGDLKDALQALPSPDLCIFGLQRDAPNLAWAEHMVYETRSSCLFVLDSGRESARA